MLGPLVPTPLSRSALVRCNQCSHFGAHTLEDTSIESLFEEVSFFNCSLWTQGISGLHLWGSRRNLNDEVACSAALSLFWDLQALKPAPLFILHCNWNCCSLLTHLFSFPLQAAELGMVSAYYTYIFTNLVRHFLSSFSSPSPTKCFVDESWPAQAVSISDVSVRHFHQWQWRKKPAVSSYILLVNFAFDSEGKGINIHRTEQRSFVTLQSLSTEFIWTPYQTTGPKQFPRVSGEGFSRHHPPENL